MLTEMCKNESLFYTESER